VLYFLTPALATRRRKLGALEGAELDRTGTGSQRRSRGCARLRRLLQLVRFELALQGCPAPWIGHHLRVCGECSTTRKKYATDEPARTNTTDVRDFDLALRSSPRPALATSRTTSRPNDGHPPLPRRHRLRVLPHPSPYLCSLRRTPRGQPERCLVGATQHRKIVVNGLLFIYI